MLGGILTITEIKPRTNFADRYGIYSLYAVACGSTHEARAANSRIPPAIRHPPTDGGEGGWAKRFVRHISIKIGIGVCRIFQIR